ncbi:MULTISPECIES: ABC transporter permease [unclassified Dietzia]|uniref:ABC transporter permease n=1 Tax=unclassified Dietzia TaxID=2617939 RepID=UPI000D200D85|nr:MULTISPECIES: ABC transporter permease subunit [unclassified Dietzia]AVZ40794.1 molybdate ABC transporter permease subunit [Dietzia sp. JS16-p6b]QGW26396.1 sulfate/thiosulfate ABC superfamily ATP binding cassette transporter, membrane protein [Dietzia sp. DQ12-45-1b]
MATVLTPTTTPAPPPPGSAPRRRWRAARTTLTRPVGVALGVSVLWFSLLVLIPLALVVISAAEGGWETFRSTLTNVQTANAIRLTLFSALAATGVNMVVGTLIAWVLVRDRFPGKRVIELVIDIPFALPSLVAGLVLLSLYGPNSPLGLTIAGTPYSVFLAVLFVTLPFVVRTVEPVLLELDPQVEQAARSLGASRAETFRRIVLPTLTPAIAAGATLSFARGVGEFGALVLFTGNRPNISEGAPIRIQSYIEIDNVAAAATVAVVLLAVALLAIAILDVISRRVARHG